MLCNSNLDIAMLALFNSKERDEGDWEDLFAAADSRFKVQGIIRMNGARLDMVIAQWVH